MSIWLLWVCALMALEHSLSITLSMGEYPGALRSASMSVNAAIMASLVVEGMAWTRMAFRL